LQPDRATLAYSIYVLPETAANMTITGTNGGNGLDGITQGSGIHLDGATITLHTRNWQEVLINDNDDNFEDNDAGQSMANQPPVDGMPFNTGDVVEAEYSFVVTDGDQTWTLVAFNIRNSSPSYATVEGLAFVGPQGEFPPIDTPLTVISYLEGPSFAASDYVTPVCFAAGTSIAVPGGVVAVEDLTVGNLVLTRDHGPQCLRWIGKRQVAAWGRFAPIEFAPGTIGNTAPLRVSRQHRLRYSGWKAELLFGEDAVLVPAAHFENGTTIRRVEGGLITYVHLLFDSHQIVYAEGAEAESFHPTPENLASLSRAARQDLIGIFPGLGAGQLPIATLAHPPLTGHEARALLSA
jgi:hypothetical protein